jgi:hypothetical protein
MELLPTFNIFIGYKFIGYKYENEKPRKLNTIIVAIRLLSSYS